LRLDCVLNLQATERGDKLLNRYLQGGEKRRCSRVHDGAPAGGDLVCAGDSWRDTERCRNRNRNDVDARSDCPG
jgi:hypothetical protein